MAKGMKNETAERNRRIYYMRICGMKLKEIGEEYGIGVERVRQIVIKEARKLRGYKPELCHRYHELFYCEADPEGKNYIIRNGAGDMFLTSIETVKGIKVYTYGSNDWKKGMRFTLEEAREIARKRKAVVVWLGV